MGIPEYIEREAAVNATLKLVPKVDDDGYCWVIRGDVARAIDSIPAADARPVVLCRDCKYYYKDADGYEMCENSEGYDHVREDGFCAWAKKREES